MIAELKVMARLGHLWRINLIFHPQIARTLSAQLNDFSIGPIGLLDGPFSSSIHGAFGAFMARLVFRAYFAFRPVAPIFLKIFFAQSSFKSRKAVLLDRFKDALYS